MLYQDLLIIFKCPECLRKSTFCPLWQQLRSIRPLSKLTIELSYLTNLQNNRKQLSNRRLRNNLTTCMEQETMIIMTEEEKEDTISTRRKMLGILQLLVSRHTRIEINKLNKSQELKRWKATRLSPMKKSFLDLTDLSSIV